MKRRVLNPKLKKIGGTIERFDPNAYDGDGDGFVQDTTIFERPSKPKRKIPTTSGRMSSPDDEDLTITREPGYGYDTTDPASKNYDDSENLLFDVGEALATNPDLIKISPEKTPEAIARLSGKNMDIFNRRRMRNVEPSGHYTDDEIRDVISSIRVEVADDGIATIIVTPPEDVRAIIPTNWNYANVRLPNTEERISIYRRMISYLENPPPGAEEIEHKDSQLINDDSYIYENIFENDVEPLLDSDYEYRNRLINSGKITKLGNSLQFDEMIERHMRMPSRSSVLEAYQDTYMQAVHDWVGHIGTGRGFDRHGEFANFLALVDLFESRTETEAEREAVAYFWFKRIFIGQLMSWEKADVKRNIPLSDEALKLINKLNSSSSWTNVEHISRDLMRILWKIDDPQTYAPKKINTKQMSIEKINKLSLAYLHSMIDNGFPQKTNRVHDSFKIGKPMRLNIESKALPFKRTIMSQRFDPNAYDGDSDGFVQDNTVFERPAVRKAPSQSGSMGADDADKIITSMYQDGKTLNEISEATGLSYNDVKTKIRRLQRNGIMESRSKRVRKWIPSDDEQQIMNMFFVEGLKPEQIAKNTNIPREKIDRTIKYARKQGYKKSSNKPLDKIDNEILKLWNDGYLEKEILEEVNINNEELQSRLENLSNRKLITLSKRDRKLAPSSMSKNEELILRAYDAGRSIREISRATGMSPLTIQDVLNTFRRKDSDGRYSIERARSAKKPSQSGRMQIDRFDSLYDEAFGPSSNTFRQRRSYVGNRQQDARMDAIEALVNDLINRRRKKLTRAEIKKIREKERNRKYYIDKKKKEGIDVTAKPSTRTAPKEKTPFEELVLKAHDKGMSISEIANATNMTNNEIESLLKTFRQKDDRGRYSIERPNSLATKKSRGADKKPRKKRGKPSQSGSMSAPFNPDLKRDKTITDYTDDPRLDLSEEEISQSIDYMKYALHHEFNPDGTKKIDAPSPVADEDNFNQENHPIHSYNIETGKPVTILAMNDRFSESTQNLINNGFQPDKEPQWMKESVRLNGRRFEFEGAPTVGALEILSYMGWDDEADEVGRRPVESWKIRSQNPILLDWDNMKRSKSKYGTQRITEVSMITEMIDSLGGESRVKRLAQQIVDRGYLAGDGSLVIPKRGSIFELVSNYKNIRELKDNNFREVFIELAREAGHDLIIERAFERPYMDPMASIIVLNDDTAEFLGARPRFSPETIRLVTPSQSGSMAAPSQSGSMADRGRKFRPLDELDEEVIRLYNMGTSRQEIRNQLGIDTNDLSNRISTLQRRGFIGGRSEQRGVDVEKKPKLTRQTGSNNKKTPSRPKRSVKRQISQLERMILEAYKNGRTIEQIAKATGISRMQVRQIIMELSK